MTIIYFTIELGLHDLAKNMLSFEMWYGLNLIRKCLKFLLRYLGENKQLLK